MDKIAKLKKAIEEKLIAAKNEESVDEKIKLLDEVDALNKELETEERLIEAEKAAALEKANEETPKEELKGYEKAVKEMAAAARKNFNEGTGADGGFTVPEDISTRINKFRDANVNLRHLVSIENVKTLSGQRTYQKRGHGTGFSSVAEGSKIPNVTPPKFMRISYNILKYGGYMFSTNELLEDSDANIVETIIEWFGENARVTDNKLVLAALNTKYTRTKDPATAESISGLDDIKKILNVKLGQTFAPTSTIVTNDDGLQWLDTLKDKDGNSLLKEYENDSLKKYVSVGFRKIPLVIIPNNDLASDATKGVPFYIGDLKDAVKLYDRKSLSIKASDVATAGTGDNAINAFDEDLRVWRGIVRLDTELIDEDAYYLGYYKETVENAG